MSAEGAIRQDAVRLHELFSDPEWLEAKITGIVAHFDGPSEVSAEPGRTISPLPSVQEIEFSRDCLVEHSPRMLLCDGETHATGCQIQVTRDGCVEVA